MLVAFLFYLIHHYFRDEEIYSSMKALDQVIDEEYASLSQLQLLRAKSEKKIKEKYIKLPAQYLLDIYDKVFVISECCSSR